MTVSTPSPSSIRFQLSATLYNRLAEQSKLSGVPMSEMIRRAVEAALPKPSTLPKQRTGK